MLITLHQQLNESKEDQNDVSQTEVKKQLKSFNRNEQSAKIGKRKPEEKETHGTDRLK